MYILFGLPGAGKTFVGEVFQNHFGFHYYEGDNDLTDEMKKAIKTQTVFTDSMRDRFFTILIEKMRTLNLQYSNLVVSQMFIKEKYRQWVLDAIPDANFILIEANNTLREQRLQERVIYPLDGEYARIMVKNFEKPSIPHIIMQNNIEGSEKIQKQIAKLLNS